MKISERGINLIKKWEGFKDKAYLCSANVWTVGFGTTRWLNGEKVKQGDTITRKLAEQLLLIDVHRFSSQVLRLVQVPLTQSQFDALVSFTYNLGGGALERSTLLKKLNAGDYKGAAKQFDRWVNAGGKRVQGLVNRRKEERAMFEEYSIFEQLPDSNNTPLRNRDLPLPTAIQEHGEPETKMKTETKTALAAGGVVGGAGVIEAVQNVSPVLSGLSMLDWRVGLVVVVVVAIAGAVWLWRKKR